MAQIPSKNLTIGKGQLFFGRFTTVNPVLPQNVFRDLGNAPGVSLNVTSESLEHFSSRGGLNEKDADILLSRKIDGTITIEDMDPENIALFFLGTTSKLTQASVASAVETFTNVVPGLWYQLGVHATRPEGYKKVTVTSATLANTPNTPLVVNVDYEIDAERGFFRIIPGTTVVTGAHLTTGVTITVSVGAHTRTRVISGDAEARGSLRYDSYNAYGDKQDYFFPNVTLKPNGDLQLISTEFMSFEFSFSASGLGTFPAVISNAQPVL